MTDMTHPEWLRPIPHPKLGTAFVVLLLAALAVGGTLLLQRSQSQRLPIPDEKAVAADLLAQKLTGPRYFQRTAPERTPQIRGGALTITVDEATAQVERVVTERHLDAKDAAKVRQLIDQLATPPRSRMTGEDSINLLRLNLALDELR